MANLVKCPKCGESNPAGQEFCQYCRSPLNPQSGDVQSIKPGQTPTKKSTADLEPVLPQWLKDARDSARQSYEEEPPKSPQSAPSVFAGADLLAGLQSQAQEDDEEIPDWLANITGQAPKPPKPQASSEVRWVEFGGSKDFTQPIPKPKEPEPESDIPSWMSSQPEESEIPPWTPPQSQESGTPSWMPSQPQEPETPSWMSQPAGEKDELTDWLRATDASQQADQPFSFDASSADATPSSDWLHSMVPDNEAAFDDSAKSEDTFLSSDTPDWLRGLEGADSSGGSSAPAFSDTPDWLKAMDAQAAAPKAAPQADLLKAQPAPSDTPDWLKAMDAQAGVPQATPSDTPDWLKAMDSQAAAPQADDTPDWLKAMDAQSAAPQAAPSDTPDWLKGMDSQAAAPQADETPDWMKAMDAQAGVPQAAPSDTPDWLRAMDAQSAAPQADDTPDWLKAMGEQGEPQGDDSAIFAGSGLGVAALAAQPSDWLEPESSESAASQDWLKDIPADKPAYAAQPTIGEDEAELPSWLKAAAPQSSIFAEPPAAQEEPLPAAPAASTPPPPAAQPSPNADSLFTELPDWLSIVDETTAPPDSIPSAITNVDAIAPGELPSWVQAMRPVDAGIPQVVAAMSADRTMETRGALAGLQGVLPAAPGYAPTSKPKAYSIKLQASDEQLSHASLLERILSAETAPVSIGALSLPGASRALRWSLSVLLLVIFGVLLLRTTFFAMPDGVLVPLEVGGAVNVIQSIPQDAPVLAIFDYEPARAGEVETVAVPMFDQLLMRHSRLTFISTTETGALLSERLISTGYLAGHKDVQYMNLGYLPGGQLGIRAFAENPPEAVPYVFADASLYNFVPEDPWVTSPLSGVTSFPQFAALILVTDDADSARAWIEQTQSVRGEVPVPLVVVSSAQAAPMLQPYYASGQISGLVSGLHGGALFEQRNNQQPGTARAYWDAYNIGLLFAVALILIGGAINLILGMRDHSAVREEE